MDRIGKVALIAIALSLGLIAIQTQTPVSASIEKFDDVQMSIHSTRGRVLFFDRKTGGLWIYKLETGELIDHRALRKLGQPLGKD